MPKFVSAISHNDHMSCYEIDPNLSCLSAREMQIQVSSGGDM